MVFGRNILADVSSVKGHYLSFISEDCNPPRSKEPHKALRAHPASTMALDRPLDPHRF